MSFNPNRLAVKFFTADETTIDLAQSVTVMQRWIQSHTVDGLLIDVIDYKHVPDGPGVVLIGHEGDYSLDQKNGELGLLYTLKRDASVSEFTGQLALSLQRALQAVQALSKDRTLKKPQFVTTDFELRILDRRTAPNTLEGLALVQNAVTRIFNAWGIGIAGLESAEADPRDVLTLRITAEVDLATVSEKFASDTVLA